MWKPAKVFGRSFQTAKLHRKAAGIPGTGEYRCSRQNCQWFKTGRGRYLILLKHVERM